MLLAGEDGCGQAVGCLPASMTASRVPAPPSRGQPGRDDMTRAQDGGQPQQSRALGVGWGVAQC